MTFMMLTGYCSAQSPEKIDTPPQPQVKNAAIDPGAPPKTRIPLTPSLSAGGRVKFEYVLEKDFDLNHSISDDRNILNPELSLAFLYNPGKNVQMFLNLGLSEEVTFSKR